MVKPRNTSSLQRKKIKGQERKLILIVVEGEDTEVIYFNSLRKALRLTNVSIEVEPSKHSAPLHVVKYADQLKSRRIEESRKNNNKSPYDEIFCVIDGDHPDENNYYDARDLANKKKFQFIPSIPCFELWFLLHFEDSTKSYQSCESLQQNLKKYINNYQKNCDIYTLLIDQPKAIKNAKKLEKFHDNNGNHRDRDKNPSTQVYRIVEQLIKEKSYQG